MEKEELITGTSERKWVKALGTFLWVVHLLSGILSLVAAGLGVAMFFDKSNPSFATYALYFTAIGFPLAFGSFFMAFLIRLYTNLWVKTHHNTCALEEEHHRIKARLTSLEAKLSSPSRKIAPTRASSNVEELSPAELAAIRFAVLEGEDSNS